jgi:3-mercaptopyruvate sulfurtransferase SseA
MVLHVATSRKEYSPEHIPGAQFLWFYDLLTFDYFGLGERTGILDGGLQAWKDAGGAVTAKLPTVEPGSFKPTPAEDMLVDGDWIRNRLSDGTVALIDTRGKSSFEGKSGGVPRHGHIPGASNVPTTTGIDSLNRFVNEAEFGRLLKSAGITKQQRLVPYCQVGQSASVIYFLARAYGWTTSFYDGSYEDWSSRGEEYPVERVESSSWGNESYEGERITESAREAAASRSPGSAPAPNVNRALSMVPSWCSLGL